MLMRIVGSQPVLTVYFTLHDIIHSVDEYEQVCFEDDN